MPPVSVILNSTESVPLKIAETDGNRYQCIYVKCKKILTTLELAQKHLQVSGHKKLVMMNLPNVDTDDETELEIIHAAPVIYITQFVKQLFKHVDYLDNSDSDNDERNGHKSNTLCCTQLCVGTVTRVKHFIAV